MPAPANPKIYHIVHVDRLDSILTDGRLWSDEQAIARQCAGTTIGMSDIKARRLRTKLESHPTLAVGQCVPFYFCPRSVMLYLLHMGNHPGVTYQDGQRPLITLEADLRETVEWAEDRNRRWAFTLTNAGSTYFEDRSDIDRLDEIDWPAVAARDWRSCKEGKQAEFLLERSFPWDLVRRIGTCSTKIAQRIANSFDDDDHRPPVEIRREWYY